MSGAQVRLSDAMLRTLGGRTVLLHIPAPAIPGDAGEQVGLAVPQFQDLELGPVIFRRVRGHLGSFEAERSAEYELLVSASAVETLVGSLAFQSARVLFAQAAGVVVDDALLQIVAVASAQMFGAVYLYRLALREGAAGLV